MSDTVKKSRPSPFLINLDGEIITLPGRSLESMLGMFVHLEALSARQGSYIGADVLTPKAASGVPQLLPKPEAFMAQRISFRELGRQIIRAAQSQISVLRVRVEQMQSLVLINHWPAAERLWAEFLPDCKTPLYELNFLEELWGINPERLEVDGWSLMRHWQQFVLIQAEIEVLLARRQSLLQLSDTLEGQLGTWLKRFDSILEKLDEKSLS
jgi:hypothetical protein